MGFLRKACVGLVMAVAGGLLAPSSPVAAQVSPSDAQSAALAVADARISGARLVLAPVIADFEGRRINLVNGWDQAQACMVRRQGPVECFRTVGALEVRAGTLQAQQAGAYWCAQPLRLYEHSYFAGRQLIFYDRGYWQNLPDYGFNDEMTSYSIGACNSYLAEHINGGGAWYPGPTTPYSSVGWPASGWDNRVSSVYLT